MSKNNSVSEKYEVKNALVNYYLAIMFSVFPLFATDSYSNIRHDKLYFFVYLSFALVVVETVILVASLFSKRTRTGQRWYKQLSLTDYSFAAVILCFTLSTIFAEFPADSLSGSQGRNNGLLLFILYFAVYIVISRLYQFREYVFAVLAVGSSVVFALCVLNFFGVDPLGMYNQNYSEAVRADFISTIGNRNMMSCFCCIVIPALAVLYINCRSALRFLYLVGCGLGFASVLCSDSESGFLGLVPVMLVILLYCCRIPQRLFRFFALASVMLFCAKLLSFFVANGRELGTLQHGVISSIWSWIMLGVLVALSVMFFFAAKNSPEKLYPKAVFRVLLAIALFFAGAIAALFVYFSFIDTSSELNSFFSLFRFNARWGTHRGYIWIKAWRIFTRFDLKSILFGSGCDTFYSQFSPYFSTLYSRFGDSSTNAAHNEFLNYLVCNGVMGLAAYLALVGSVIVRALKAARTNLLALVFAAPVLCYLFQSVVNIATPITTPFMFIFLALSENISRKENKTPAEP